MNKLKLINQEINIKNIILWLLLSITVSTHKIVCVGYSITINGYSKIVKFWMVKQGLNWRVLNLRGPGASVLINRYKVMYV